MTKDIDDDSPDDPPPEGKIQDWDDSDTAVEIIMGGSDA